MLNNKKFISVLIQDSVIKLAQVGANGSVEKFARLESAGTSADDLAATIKRSGFDLRCSCVCTISSSAGSTKNIEVPSHDVAEIASIVNLQATRYTPYTKEEIIVGFASGGVNKSNTQGLLVIVNKKVIQDRLNVCERAGLRVEHICYAPEAMGRFYAKNLQLKKGGSTKGVLDFTADGIDFMIIRERSVIFSRYIPVGVKGLHEGGEAQAKIIEEVNKSISSYSQEDIGQVPAEYVVSTSNELVRNFLPILSEKIGTAFVLSPFTDFCKMSKNLRNKIESEFADDSFLDVIASGIMSSSSGVNLLPDDLILKRQFDRQSRDIATMGVVGAVLLVLVGVLLLMQVYFKDTFLNKNLRERYATQHEEALNLENKQKRNQMIRDYLTNRSLSLDILKALYDVTPVEVYLSNITTDDQGNITIEGISDTMSGVFSFTKLLEDSAMFKSVKTKNTATKKDQGKDVASFEITMRLESAPDLKDPKENKDTKESKDAAQ